MSICRQNYHDETEAAINDFINTKMRASYMYQSLHGYFDRDDIALPGARSFFDQLSASKRRNVDLLTEYQNKRGGRINLRNIERPIKDSWGTPVQAMEEAVMLEKQLNQEALNLYKHAQKHHDEHLEDFIEDKFLIAEVDSIKQMSDYLTNMKRVGTGLGAYLFDKETLKQ